MLCKPRQGCSEESYYLSEWTQSERAQGLHLPALAFAYEAKSERGWDAAGPRAALPMSHRGSGGGAAGGSGCGFFGGGAGVGGAVELPPLRHQQQQQQQHGVGNDSSGGGSHPLTAVIELGTSAFSTPSSSGGRWQ